MSAITVRKRMLTMCVIGIGGEGENLAARIRQMGHKVARFPETPTSLLEFNVYHNHLINLKPDVIVFATSTKNFGASVTLYPPNIFEDVLVVSYLPVMGPAREALINLLPKSAGIITAGQIIGDWYQRPFCVDLVRIHEGKIHRCAEEFLTIFDHQECQVREIPAHDFDKSMATAEFLPMVIGKTLVELNFPPSVCDKESTEQLLQVADGAFVTNYEVLYTLFKYSPVAKVALADLEKAFKKVREKLEDDEKKEMRNRRQEVEEAERSGTGNLLTSHSLRRSKGF